MSVLHTRMVFAFAVMCLCLASDVSRAQAQLPRDLTLVGRRLALVVGIDSYPKSPLLNARNDAQAMAAMLRELGFAVTLLQDIPRSQLVSSVAGFGELLRPDDVAFFFYAGHGLQIDGENYLVPADFDASSSAAARLNTMPVSEVQTAFSKAKVSVLVLDACRNNPFSNTRSGGRGLAPVEARGNIIAFATGAGQLASDNPLAANGLFTQQLLTTLKEPNLPLREVFYRVRQRVYNATNGEQFPAVYDGLLGEIVLRSDGTGMVGPPVVVAPTVSPAPPPVAVPVSPSKSTPAPAGAVPSEVRFELMHIHQSSDFSMHRGALTISTAQLMWSEERGNDAFAVSCASIDEISAKSRWTNPTLAQKNRVYLSNVNIRIKKKYYDFFVELDNRPIESLPSASAVVAAIQTVCPAVKVTK
jgi:Caspase domain